MVNNMRISFGANYIKPVEIAKKQGQDMVPEKASLVELDVYNLNDYQALDETVENWGRNSYLSCIWDEIDNSEHEGIDYHIYAVTTQKDSFDKLDDKKILGACLFNEHSRANELELLQVQPDNLATLKTEDGYRRVGTAIVDSLKAIHPDKPIKVYAAYSAVDFYKKSGFQPTKEGGNFLIWKR